MAWRLEVCLPQEARPGELLETRVSREIRGLQLGKQALSSCSGGASLHHQCPLHIPSPSPPGTGCSWSWLEVGTQRHLGKPPSSESSTYPPAGPKVTPSSVGSWHRLNSTAGKKTYPWWDRASQPQRGQQRPAVHTPRGGCGRAQTRGLHLVLPRSPPDLSGTPPPSHRHHYSIFVAAGARTPKDPTCTFPARRKALKGVTMGISASEPPAVSPTGGTWQVSGE